VALLRQGRLALPTDGGGIMSWIYLDDAVAATVAALERGRPGQAYNLVDDEPVRWRDFLGALARAVEAPPPRGPCQAGCSASCPTPRRC
jgi:nucleoside-diphosphate-sugar epimerase